MCIKGRGFERQSPRQNLIFFSQLQIKKEILNKFPNKLALVLLKWRETRPNHELAIYILYLEIRRVKNKIVRF